MILVAMVLLLGQAPQDVDHEAVVVSMAAIIANPAKYDGRRVQVTGFMTVGFEIDRLYFHEGDAKRGIRENSIWLELREKRQVAEKLSMQYVVIVGTFRKPIPTSWRPDSGTLELIGRLDAVPVPAAGRFGDGGAQ